MSKPEIILPSGSVTITECADSLFRIIAERRDMFMRGGAIQELTRDDEGTLGLSVVRPDAFRSRIEDYAKVRKYIAIKDGVALKDTVCPDETAKALMAARPADVHLPRIRGLASCPIAVNGKDGFKTHGKGYSDATGGVLVTGGGLVEDIPTNEAVAYLKGLVDEFAFNSPADRARAIAMLITPALRIGGWMRGHCPIFVIEANASQTGKGYLLNILSALYSERPYFIGKKEGGVGSLDESLSAALLAGRPFIQLDNLRGRISSAFLEMVITSGGLVQCRVPHRGEVAVDSTYFTFLLTSNGAETTEDLANRACIIRIRKREGFRYRDYPEGDLVSHIKANQMRYLSSVFSVLKAWAGVGCAKNRDECRHDFREWAQSLDFIVRNIVGESPIMDGHEDAKTTVSNPALVWLRAVAIAIEASGRISEDFTASSLAEISSESDIEIPACRSDSEEDRRKRIGVLLHRLIPSDFGAVEFDAYRVSKTVEECFDEGHNGVRNRKIYRFSQVVAPQQELNLLPQLPQPVKDSVKVGIFQEVYGVEAVISGDGKNAPVFEQKSEQISMPFSEEF